MTGASSNSAAASEGETEAGTEEQRLLEREYSNKDGGGDNDGGKDAVPSAAEASKPKEIRPDDHNDGAAADDGEATDGEGLLERGYDAVVCGTDLVQSVLASALTRAGLKVLHCDGNGWYGGLDASLCGGSAEALREVLEGLHNTGSSGANAGGGGERGDDSRSGILISPYDLAVHSQTLYATDPPPPPLSGCSPSADGGGERDAEGGPKSEGGIGKENPLPLSESGEAVASSASVSAAERLPLLPLERGFALDLTPHLLHARGSAVDGILQSGVADYLEFKSLEGVYVLMPDKDSGCGKKSRGKGSGTGGGREGDGEKNGTNALPPPKLTLHRVPCSKGDVFQSSLLSPADKRRLMKFLRLVTDYGTASSDGGSEGADGDGSDESDSLPVDASAGSGGGGDEAVRSVNERHLHRGRALSRPQNKAAPSSSEMDALMRSIRNGDEFEDYLEKAAKLPERLRRVVVHALALAPSTSSSMAADPDSDPEPSTKAKKALYPTSRGIQDLLRHVNALGRFGDTAFLVPLYGAGELSQAFCRSAAVHGGTYMLRRAPRSVLLHHGGREGDDNDGDGVIEKDEQGGTMVVRGIVLGGESAPPSSSSDKVIKCRHVIVPDTMLLRGMGVGGVGNHSPPATLRVHRRIGVLSAKLIRPRKEQQRTGGRGGRRDGGGSVTNGSAKDSNSSDELLEQRYVVVIPPDTPGLDNPSAIRGVALDKSVFVAPGGMGEERTVLHLTMTTAATTVVSDAACADLLKRAMCLLFERATENGGSPCEELRHLAFTYGVEDGGGGSHNNSDGDAPPELLPRGMHVCRRGEPSVACDDVFVEAERVFREICGTDREFLVRAKEVEDEIVYRNDDDSDNEGAVLESAFAMIDTTGDGGGEGGAVENDTS